MQHIPGAFRLHNDFTCHGVVASFTKPPFKKTIIMPSGADKYVIRRVNLQE
jgi:hypothetical protein